MMKKVVYGFLLGTIICCLGCGANKNTAAENPNEDIPISQETDREQSVSDTETENADNSQATSASYLNVSTDYHWDNCIEDVMIMDAHYDTINFSSAEYPLLTEAVQNYNTDYTNSVESSIEEMTAWGLEEYEEYGADAFLGPYTYQADMFICRGDSAVLSVGMIGYVYQGGVHGTTWFDSVNFDAQTGEEISLEAVIPDMNGLSEIIAQEILEKYPDITYWTDTLEETIQDYVLPAEEDSFYELTWTLGYDGVTFYFGNYDIGSYADGLQVVTVTRSEYPEIFADSYFACVDTDYAVSLPTWYSDTDLNDDGVTDYISVTGNYNPDYGQYESYVIQINDFTYQQDTYYYDLETYFVKNGTDNYLYIERTAESDYRSVGVYKITPDEVSYIGEFGGGIGSFTNGRNFEIIRRVDLLSTYSIIVDSYMGEDGMPVAHGDVYEVEYAFTLTSIAPIEAELTDGNGNLTGETCVFPEGTNFTFVRTDGESFTEMCTDDGQYCIFYVEPGWPVTVNGTNGEELFEMMFFAG